MVTLEETLLFQEVVRLCHVYSKRPIYKAPIASSGTIFANLDRVYRTESTRMHMFVYKLELVQRY